MIGTGPHPPRLVDVDVSSEVRLVLILAHAENLPASQAAGQRSRTMQLEWGQPSELITESNINIASLIDKESQQV